MSAGRRGVSTCGRPAAVHCSACDAVCCRLTVILESGDDVPPHLTTRLHGLHVMARDPEGWCLGLDGRTMNCRIYASRPVACRSFVMGGPYCRSIRDEYSTATTPSGRNDHEENR
nr:YkgJ family cysteine cluster protein [Stenotrophomonas mori]